MRLTQTSRAPLFVQIAASIRTDIRNGRLSPGERLPPGRLLATTLNVNAHTVLRAYQLLRDEGMLEIRRGRGATVVEPVDPMVSIQDALERAATVAATSGVKRQTLHGLLISFCEEKGVTQ